MSLSRSYYVSSHSGSDQNDGSSPSTAFQTLHKINCLKLQPGTQVLLECGSVFENQFLRITDSGTLEQQIEITSYGDGDIPLIEANGNGIWYQDYGVALDAPTHVSEGYVSSAVLLYDTSHILLHDIEITNRAETIPGEEYSAPHKMNRTGVAVVAKDKGTIQNITLRALFIHDVHGNVYDKHMNNGGIYATALQPEDEETTGVARFDGFVVEDCYVNRVSRWGIAVGYTYEHARFQASELLDEWFTCYGHEHIILRNNYVKNAGGDGITAMYALRPLIEHNMSDFAAREINDRIYRFPMERKGKVAAGIWPWKCKDALFTYNRTVNTRLNQDGMAYDADSGDGTVYQYNYSRLNEGGCVMFCLEQAVHNTFCHNVSMDDLGGTISPADNPDAYIADNTFYVRKSVPFVRPHMDGGSYTVENNTFIIWEEENL